MGVLAYSTVYWRNSTYGPLQYCSMADQNINGGWSVDDSQISVTNRKFDMGQSGPSYYTTVTQYIPTQSPGLDYTYQGPTNWLPVQNINGGLSAVGMNSSATLVRGGSSWSLPFKNFICQ